MPDATESILSEAERIIHGPRNQDYGTPLQNHTTTAELWSAYLKALQARGGSLQAEDVCMLNILQKVARLVTTGLYKRDSIVDIAGYAGNVEMCQDERNR